MAARLILNRQAGMPPPIPTFWHILLWVALRHCDHQLDSHSTDIVDLLGSLFDHMYIGGTGQMAGGRAKRDSLGMRSCMNDMKLRSNISQNFQKYT